MPVKLPWAGLWAIGAALLLMATHAPSHAHISSPAQSMGHAATRGREPYLKPPVISETGDVATDGSDPMVVVPMDMLGSEAGASTVLARIGTKRPREPTSPEERPSRRQRKVVPTEGDDDFDPIEFPELASGEEEEWTDWDDTDESEIGDRPALKRGASPDATDSDGPADDDGTANIGAQLGGYMAQLLEQSARRQQLEEQRKEGIKLADRNELDSKYLVGRSPRLQNLVSLMDTRIDPCTNFHMYACNTFTYRLMDVQIEHINMLNLLSAQADEYVDNELLNGYSRASGLNLAPAERISERSVYRKMSLYYEGCMDARKLDREGITALRPHIDAVLQANMSTLAGRADAFAAAHRVGTSAVFFARPTLSPSRQDSLALGLTQAPLTLRPELLRKKPIVYALRQFIALQLQVFRVLPDDANVPRLAIKIAQLELALARLIRKKPTAEEFFKTKRYTVRQLQQRSAGMLDWNRYLTQLGVKRPFPKIQWTNDDFVARVAGALDAAGPQTVQAYLVFRMLMEYEDALPPSLFEAQRLLFASLDPRADDNAAPHAGWRQKLCLEATRGDFSLLREKIYVDKFLRQGADEYARELSGRIKGVFRSSLSNAAWLDAGTRRAALHKLDQLNEDNVGLPAWLKDPSELAKVYPVPVDRDRYLDTRIRIQLNDMAVSMASLRRPPDLNTFGYDVIDVALNIPQVNMFAISGAFINRHMLDPRRKEPYLDLARFGFLAGHEMSHTFDPTSRRLDAYGRVRNWWSAKSESAYLARVKCFRDYYGDVKIPTERPRTFLRLNSTFTKEEDFADYSGLGMAWKAWRQLAQSQKLNTTAPAIVLPDKTTLSQDQLFFVAYAQNMCVKASTRSLTHQLATDTHAPDAIRGSVPLAHMREFADAFQCSSSSAMVPTKRCELW